MYMVGQQLLSSLVQAHGRAKPVLGGTETDFPLINLDVYAIHPRYHCAYELVALPRCGIGLRISCDRIAVRL